MAGVRQVSGYISKLYSAGEITLAAYCDSGWQRHLEKKAEKALEATLTGSDSETRADAERIAEEIVDQELE